MSVLPDWLALAQHLGLLSLISMGGPVALIPDIHSYLVNQHHWISEKAFTDSVVIAQTSPGPNVLFLVLIGWNIGLNSGSYIGAILGALCCLFSYLLPCSIFFICAAKWVEKYRFARIVRAFKFGMGPIVVSLLIASGVVIAYTSSHQSIHWQLWLLVLLTVALVISKKVSMLLLLLLGAALGALGFL